MGEVSRNVADAIARGLDNALQYRINRNLARKENEFDYQRAWNREADEYQRLWDRNENEYQRKIKRANQERDEKLAYNLGLFNSPGVQSAYNFDENPNVARNNAMLRDVYGFSGISAARKEPQKEVIIPYSEEEIARIKATYPVEMQPIVEQQMRDHNAGRRGIIYPKITSPAVKNGSVSASGSGGGRINRKDDKIVNSNYEYAFNGKNKAEEELEKINTDLEKKRNEIRYTRQLLNATPKKDEKYEEIQENLNKLLLEEEDLMADQKRETERLDKFSKKLNEAEYGYSGYHGHFSNGYFSEPQPQPNSPAVIEQQPKKSVALKSNVVETPLDTINIPVASSTPNVDNELLNSDLATITQRLIHANQRRK